jgi:hypothetical protein
LFHFLDFCGNFLVLLLHEAQIVIAVVDLAGRTEVGCFHACQTVVGYGSVHGLNLGVHTDAGVADFSLCGRLAHRRAQALSS